MPLLLLYSQDTTYEVAISLLGFKAQVLDAMFAIIFVLSLWGSSVYLLNPENETDDTPPEPAYVGFAKDTLREVDVGQKDHAWENSGQLEGDIMIYKNENEFDRDAIMQPRNGVSNYLKRWPKGIVPYYITKGAFPDDAVKSIKKAMATISKQSCVRFRKYRRIDLSYVAFRSDGSGCWSTVGRKIGGQVVNLAIPRCITLSTITHEIMHALGFYHQQSSSNRDKYVKIDWKNVKEGEEHNFKKQYRTTNFGAGYDFDSLMHYSDTAYSKNGKPTIISLVPGSEVKWTDKLSEGDIIKLNKMYKKKCKNKGVLANILK